MSPENVHVETFRVFRSMRIFDKIVRLGTGDRFVGPMFRRLFLPSIVFSTGWALSDIVDSVVVGQKLGTTGLAAIGMILPIYMINSALAHGFGVGGSVRFSKLMAHGEREAANRSFRQTVFTALAATAAAAVAGTCFMDELLWLLGATQASAEVARATRDYAEILVAEMPLFCLAHVLNYYLYNDDGQKLAVTGAVCSYSCDIGLNFLFVFGFGLGMRGAALATMAGHLITIAAYAGGLCFREHHLQFGWPGKAWLAEGLKNLKAGLSTSISFAYQLVFFVVCNNALVRIGGDPALAVFDLLQNTSYMLLYFFEGTSRAMQPLLATFHGENGASDMRETRSLGRLYGCVVGIAMIVAVEIWPSMLTALFGVPEGPVRELAHFALRVFCGGVLFAGLNVLDCGYFVACGVERAAFLIQSLRGALLLLPLTAVGVLIGNLRLFWLIFPMTEIGSWLLFRAISRMGGKCAVTLLPPERVYRRMVNGSTEDVMSADVEIEAFCERRGIEPKRSYAITLAVEEICETIVKNGMKDGAICITVLDATDGDVMLILRYNDDFFNPFSLYTEKASKEGEFDMDAMGILMIRKRAKDFSYRRYQGLNSLVVRL